MTSQDLAETNPRPANFTRRSSDLVAKFQRTGHWHLIPLYHLMRLSDFGREGIERSGSYLFADHLYRNHASGRGLIGKMLDRILLNMPAAQAMRRRYRHVMSQLEAALERRADPLKILALPCGIPRDLSELTQRRPELADRVSYYGMDIDPEVVQAAEAHLINTHLRSKKLIVGDALNIKTYPDRQFDMIVSTGLGEFLDDEQIKIFYQNVFDSLTDGGVFCTSATTREERSDYLLRAFELQTNYRSLEETRSLMSLWPWKSITLERDITGLQTFVTAIR